MNSRDVLKTPPDPDTGEQSPDNANCQQGSVNRSAMSRGDDLQRLDATWSNRAELCRIVVARSTGDTRKENPVVK